MSLDKQTKDAKSQKVKRVEQSSADRQIPGAYGEINDPNLLLRTLDNPHLVTSAAILQLQRRHGNRVTANVVANITGRTNLTIQRAEMTVGQALQMKGMGIRVDDSGQQQIGKIGSQGAAYLLAPNPTDILMGVKLTTEAWKASLKATVRFILGQNPPKTARLLFLTGCSYATGGAYASDKGDTFEKNPNVQGATIDSTILINGETEETLFEWVLKRVERSAGSLSDEPSGSSEEKKGEPSEEKGKGEKLPREEKKEAEDFDERQLMLEIMDKLGLENEDDSDTIEAVMEAVDSDDPRLAELQIEEEKKKKMLSWLEDQSLL